MTCIDRPHMRNRACQRKPTSAKAQIWCALKDKGFAPGLSHISPLCVRRTSRALAPAETPTLLASARTSGGRSVRADDAFGICLSEP
jgi:hypothetical protein